MSRMLASIQMISDLRPIEGADSIECAKIQGWDVVVKKGQFQVGDKVVYMEIDSLLPVRPEFEFLAKSRYRIKTIKLRGQVSQGICFPLSIIPEHPIPVMPGDVGQDLTDILGVVKYEPRLAGGRVMGGDTKGVFPNYVNKTDETRIQNIPAILEEMRGVHCYATVKVDGTSATFCRYDDEYDVCSRSRSVKSEVVTKRVTPEGEEIVTVTVPVYWQMYKKYGIEEILKEHNYLAIQGEIAGFWDEQRRSSIQRNKLKLTETELFVYDIYDIKEHRYYGFDEFRRFTDKYGLTTVPFVSSNFILDHTVQELLALAEGQYPNGGPREGLVFRPLEERHSNVLKGRMSFKVINNKFLLKHEE